MAQVHRFRDCVAVNIDTGPTVYMAPAEARAFAAAIIANADSVERFTFLDSPATTETFGDFAGPTYRHDRTQPPFPAGWEVREALRKLAAVLGRFAHIDAEADALAAEARAILARLEGGVA